MRQNDLNHRTFKGRAFRVAAAIHAARAPARLGGLTLLAAGLLAGCDGSGGPGDEARARQVEPARILARLAAVEAQEAAREAPGAAERAASYYGRRAAGGSAASEEAAAEDWPPASLRDGSFAPQALPAPPGGVAATRLFAGPEAAAALASGFSAAGGEAAPAEVFPVGRTVAPPPADAASSGGVAALGPSRRDPFQDFLEALHNARSGEDLRAAAEALAMEATAPAALTLAGSFETELPDVAVAVYDALWRVRNLPEAARRMGVAARDGRGVAQDWAAAAAYFREAAAFGDLQARRLLEDLERLQAASEF